jgi:RNA polymerase sigma-54 factor
MISLNQQFKLEQRLSPQQILLSSLLQLPLLNLEQKIKSELELNPTLEEGLELDEDVPEIENNKENIDEEEIKLLDKERKNEDYEDEELEKAQKDSDLEDFLNDESAYEIRIPKDKNIEEFDRPEVSIESLPEYLLKQFHVLPLNDDERAVGEYLIWNIKDDGYLDASISIEEVAEDFNVTTEIIDSVLEMIQKLDPTGIGARDLRECLYVQLKEQENSNKIALEILKNYFEEFKNRHYDKIRALLDITREDLQEAVDEILKLNPKPGASKFDNPSNYIVPDFIVEKVDNEFLISLNEWNIPPLRISKTYKNILRNKSGADKDAKQYIRKKIESAKWFINSIQQRRETMLKVMKALVEKQRDFFDKGPEYIKPLIMREIADMIEMDNSTISRVANGKYVQTDYGVFELKYFFTEKIETDDGEEVSTRKIKSRIKDIIAEEDNKKPLSDEKLSIILESEGFPVARRTVAKYREQLQIPVARLRRGI